MSGGFTSITPMSDVDYILLSDMPAPYDNTPPPTWLVNSIKLHGFLSAFPIILSSDGGRVVDGNKRLKAAIAAEFKGYIPVVYMECDYVQEEIAIQLLAHHGRSMDHRTDLFLVDMLLSVMNDVTDEMINSTTGMKKKRMQEYRSILSNIDRRWIERFYYANIEWGVIEVLYRTDKETQHKLLSLFPPSQKITISEIEAAIKQLKGD